MITELKSNLDKLLKSQVFFLYFHEQKSLLKIIKFLTKNNYTIQIVSKRELGTPCLAIFYLCSESGNIFFEYRKG